MTLIAIILLSLAVTIGLFLAILAVRFHRRNARLGLVHAAMAIASLGVLGAQIVQGPINKFNNVAALLLVLALIGGAMVFALREENRPPAMAIVVIHAIMALGGLAVLVFGYR